MLTLSFIMLYSTLKKNTSPFKICTTRCSLINICTTIYWKGKYISDIIIFSHSKKNTMNLKKYKKLLFFDIQYLSVNINYCLYIILKDIHIYVY